jgi:hypothetical protein
LQRQVQVSATGYVQSLLESGRVKVPPEEAAPTDLEAAVAELDRATRPDMAYDAPALSVPVAVWALALLHRASQALVFREIEAEAVRQALATPCPQPPSPSVCYSADLALRYLPDLSSLASGIAPDDPLVAGLITLGRAWPLSSVGITGLDDVDPSAFIDDPSLRQLYVDRIIERGDAARLSHPVVRSAVREAVGAFPDLAPKLAAALSA